MPPYNHEELPHTAHRNEIIYRCKLPHRPSLYVINLTLSDESHMSLTSLALVDIDLVSKELTAYK